MHPILKNSLAVVAGVVIGSAVNMTLITLGGKIVSAPEGVDVTTMEGLKKGMHLFKPINFLFPFLAHALGTFVGALFAAVIAANNKMTFAMVIGGLFLIGGIGNVFMLPSPTWFTVTDLLGAYIPMAYIAGKLVVRN